MMSSLFDYHDLDWYRESCRELYFFCLGVLSTAFLDKFNNFGMLHKWMCDWIEVKKNPTRKKFISVFRGSFKTTVLLGYCVWLFVWHLVQKKPISICYNTATKENAEAFMEEFREILRECQLLRDIFPEVPHPASGKYRKWSKYKVEYKWVKFHVASLDTRQVSRHYTVIINDDLVNDDNAFSDKERATILRKWKFQKSIITKYRKFKIGLELDVGTPFHHADLMSYMTRKIKTYDKFIMPYAVAEDGKVADLDKRNGHLTLPEMFCWEDFEDKRQEQGKSIFGSQYELRIVDETDKLCDEEWLRYWRFLPENRIRHMTIDPAGVEHKESSATGITIVDWDEAGTMYILYAQKHWVTPMKLIGLISRLQHDYKPIDETFIEKEKYSITIGDTMEHLAPRFDLSFVEHRNRPKDKRIYKLKQHLERGKVLLCQGMKELENDLLNYPDVDSSDLLDALAYQLDVADTPRKKIIPDFEPEIEEGFEEEMNKMLGLDQPEEGMDAYF